MTDVAALTPAARFLYGQQQGFRDYVACKRTGEYDSGDRPIWVLTEDLLFYSLALNCWLIVPKGFRTNFASVPRLPFVYWYCGDRCWEEPALHDFIYTAHGIFVVTLDDDGHQIGDAVFRDVTKPQADIFFRDGLLLNPKIPDGMAKTMHKAVEWWGGSSWGADSKVGQTPSIKELINYTNPTASTPTAKPVAIPSEAAREVA